jgi:hypothetical protein
MGSATVRQPDASQATDANAFKRPTPVRRPPRPLDYLLYFFGIPVGLAIVFSLVGTRLTYGMPYLDALFYMLVHMFIAWWSVNLGATIIKLSFRSWGPPVIAVCMLGLLLALIPAAFLFQAVGDFYANLHPIFATNRADTVIPNWDIAYLLHFIRYSFPVLPTFLAGVYGYRFATGVDWYGYNRNEGYTPNASAEENLDLSSNRVATLQEATAQLIDGTKLPANARLIAIKAEQHYIKIWSDQGTDMVRYRFRDLAETLQNCKGNQVHRSWWVDLGHVQSYRHTGRKLELNMGADLMIPVSLSYKNSVLAILNSK